MPTKFLSAEWCAEIAAAMDADETTKELAGWAALTLQYVVQGVPGSGEVRYFRRFDDDEVTVELGEADSPTATFTMSYETAAAINRGETSIPDAFGAGDVGIEGTTSALMQFAKEMASAATAVAAVPATY